MGSSWVVAPGTLALAVLFALVTACGSGDDAQRDSVAAPQFFFEECAEATVQAGSTCSEAATRVALSCGEPGAISGADCCARGRCIGDDDCGPNAACIPRLTQAPPQHLGSGVDSCEAAGQGQCVCSQFDDIDTYGACVGTNEGLARFDCDVSGRSCSELDTWFHALDPIARGWLVGHDEPLRQKFEACLAKVVSVRAACLG